MWILSIPKWLMDYCWETSNDLKNEEEISIQHSSHVKFWVAIERELWERRRRTDLSSSKKNPNNIVVLSPHLKNYFSICLFQQIFCHHWIFFHWKIWNSDSVTSYMHGFTTQMVIVSPKLICQVQLDNFHFQNWSFFNLEN